MHNFIKSGKTVGKGGRGGNSRACWWECHRFNLHREWGEGGKSRVNWVEKMRLKAMVAVETLAFLRGLLERQGYEV